MTAGQKLVYLAGPIDGAQTPEESRSWREFAIKHLTEDGHHTVYTPAHAFHVGRTPPTQDICEGIIHVNDQALAAADVVLACLAGASFGTPIEVDQAYRRGTPVLSFGGHKRSIYLQRFEHFATLEQAIEALTGQTIHTD